MLRNRALVAVAGLAVGLALAASPAAPASPTFAPADEATITPGVQMVTAGGQCTANFIFEDVTDPGTLYIGYAAHCAGDGGEATDTNGCLAPSLPADGTVEVEIQGAFEPGRLVYSSWETMQAVGEDDPNTCASNDFALVEIAAADLAAVNPSIPFWGGPTGLNTEGAAAGSSVHGYGNSSLRLGITALSPKSGVSLGTTADGWRHPTYTLTPGIPGDSGSALLDDQGRAVGVLSTLAFAPLAGSNNYSDLARALDYLRAHTDLDVSLVPGDVTFDPDQPPLDLNGFGLL